MTPDDSREDGVVEHTLREVSETVLEAVLSRWPVPLKGETNPAQETAERLHLDWLHRYDLVKQSCRPETMHLCEVTAYAFPHADADILALAADLTAWLFFIDELFDTGETGMRVASAREFIASLNTPPPIPVQCDTSAAAHTELLGRIRRSYRDLASRLRERMSPPQWTVFTSHLDTYYDALAAEAANREQQVAPALDDYCAIRRFSSGAQCQIDLVELSVSTRLPRYMYDLPAFHQLVHFTCDIGNWTNDVFSAAKEYVAGDVHNLVLILQQEAGCSLRQAAVEAVNRIETRLHDMQAAQAALPALLARHGASPTTQEAAQRWADGLQHFLQHAAWYLGHARYTTTGATT
ncbi:terpene synthase family protein [Streptomyces ardesiacus]|uniref:terpene synthase family protein n=1 Tax=Streptomyces ardesiacus TaxID=285564 RepID=UPI00341001F1